METAVRVLWAVARSFRRRCKISPAGRNLHLTLLFLRRPVIPLFVAVRIKPESSATQTCCRE